MTRNNKEKSRNFGTIKLVKGMAIVKTNEITLNSTIALTRKNKPTKNAGFIFVHHRKFGKSFKIISSNKHDSAQIMWVIGSV